MFAVWNSSLENGIPVEGDSDGKWNESAAERSVRQLHRSRIKKAGTRAQARRPAWLSCGTRRPNTRLEQPSDRGSAVRCDAWGKISLLSRMERAKRILPRLVQQHQATFPDKLDLVRGYWPETVGPLLADRTTPIDLKAGTLVVEAQGAPWRELLASMGTQIVRELRSELPGTDVRMIVVRLSEDGAAPGERCDP